MNEIIQRVKGSFIFHLTLVVGVFFVLFNAYQDLLHLPDETYFSSSIASSLLTSPAILGVGSIVFLPLLFWWKRISWHELESRPLMRYFICFIVLLLAWKYSTYAYNFYHNQGHYSDRILVALFAILVCFHPLFIAPFLFLCMAIVFQFDLPGLSLSWTDKKPLFQMATLFQATLYLRIFSKRNETLFWYLGLCLIGGAYLTPAICKLQLGDTPLDWLLYDDLAGLFVSSHINGWLHVVETKDILLVAGIVDKANFVLLVFSLAVELSGLFLLAGPRICRVFLIGFCLLHLGIFCFSGILFWKWIALDVVLYFVIGKMPDSFTRELFSRKHFLFSLVVLFPLSSYVFQSTPLAWFDTSLSYFHKIYVVTEEGTEYPVPKNFFSPFDIALAQDRFYFLGDERILTRTFATTSNVAIARALIETKPEQLEDLEKQYGKRYRSPKRKESFERFLVQFLKNVNQHPSPWEIPAILRPPLHIYSGFLQQGYHPGIVGDRVRVYRIKSLYDGKSVKELDKNLVLELPLGDKV